MTVLTLKAFDTGRPISQSNPFRVGNRLSLRFPGYEPRAKLPNAFGVNANYNHNLQNLASASPTRINFRANFYMRFRID